MFKKGRKYNLFKMPHIANKAVLFLKSQPDDLCHLPAETLVSTSMSFCSYSLFPDFLKRPLCHHMSPCLFSCPLDRPIARKSWVCKN